MTELPDDPRSVARQNRLRDALRENLKRRKSQLRGRAEQPGTPTDHIADPADSAAPVEPDQSS